MRNHLSALLITAMTLLALSACQSATTAKPEAAPQTQTVEQEATEEKTMAPAKGLNVPETTELTLNAGDTLKITVFNDPDLTGEYNIDGNGEITMPLIGALQAEGQSVQTLQSAIITKLENGILVDPKVSIEIAALRPFYILGEVRQPGSYPSAPNLDVFKAVAIAGGLTPRGVKDEFVIYRGFGEERQTIPAREDTPVLPGDSIRVKERFF